MKAEYLSKIIAELNESDRCRVWAHIVRSGTASAVSHNKAMASMEKADIEDVVLGEKSSMRLSSILA